MTIPLLLILATLQPQQQVEQQLQRQQQELQQVQQQLQGQEQQLNRLLNVLEHNQPKPACSAEIRLMNGGEPKTVPFIGTALVPLSFFSTVGMPRDNCLPADILVTASYFDARDNLICQGVVENVAVQSMLTQNINLDIRPWDLRQFVRWRNEPPIVNSGARRLVCMNPEGLTEVGSDELGRVSSLRVRATVLPPGGGLSTAEIRLNR